MQFAKELQSPPLHPRSLLYHLRQKSAGQQDTNICKVAEVEMFLGTKGTFPALTTINVVKMPLFGILAGHSLRYLSKKTMSVQFFLLGGFVSVASF